MRKRLDTNGSCHSPSKLDNLISCVAHFVQEAGQLQIFTRATQMAVHPWWAANHDEHILGWCNGVLLNDMPVNVASRARPRIVALSTGEHVHNSQTICIDAHPRVK